MKVGLHTQLSDFRRATGPLAELPPADFLDHIPIKEPALHGYYRRLFAAHGPQHWWPGRTRFEVIIGAILTQNTAWVNVERAIARLRRENLFKPDAIEAISSARLARLIRSSGYFRQKAKTVKAFVRFLRKEYGGSLTQMFKTGTALLREQLLSIRGIGPETADSILLYAGKHPVFVVDAYARRILERHQLTHPKLSYEEVRQFFEQNLPKDVPVYNEFHALIVHTGKEYCRKQDPRCSECPLQPLLPKATLRPS
jgi:endonuclease III related protein